MSELEKLVFKYADRSTLNMMGDRLELYNDLKLANWIREPYHPKFYDNWKRNTKLEEEEKFSGILSHRSHMAPVGFCDELEDIKLRFKFIDEFIEFLASYQNFITDQKHIGLIKESSNSFISDLLKSIDGSSWQLIEGTSSCNRWDASQFKRVSHSLPFWTLKNTITKTKADFHLGSFFDDGCVNLLMFEIMDNNRKNNGFSTLKEFKELMKFLFLDHPQKPESVTSIVLRFDKNNSQKIESWRFKKSKDPHLKKLSRLGKFWMGTGAVMAEEIQDPEDHERLYFFQPEKALEIRKTALENDLPNPYRNIARSIYDPQIEKQLRAKSI